MASPSDPEPAAMTAWDPEKGSVARLLFSDAPGFDFFQAMRLLNRIFPEKRKPGLDGPIDREIVRFQARVALDFPASTIHELRADKDLEKPARMIVAFLGMFGPSGVLPRHYTETMIREAKLGDKLALRDWLDLFNHRFTSLFLRAGEKYRFHLPFERGEVSQREPDAFSRTLFSLIGLGFRSHRQRFRVSLPAPTPAQEKPFARLEDAGLLRFSGFFAHRPRCAISLQLLLRAYLKLPVEVKQFQGQWLRLEQASQSSIGAGMQNNVMGRSCLVGDRLYDVTGKIRIRIGPIGYQNFLALLPDTSPAPQRKRIFLLAQLVRFYVGMEMDLEFQLVLRKDDVPGTLMGKSVSPVGSRLGWNTWSKRKPSPEDADDPVFTVDERVSLGWKRT